MLCVNIMHIFAASCLAATCDHFVICIVQNCGGIVLQRMCNSVLHKACAWYLEKLLNALAHFVLLDHSYYAFLDIPQLKMCI